MTTDRPRPGRVGGPLGVGIRAGGRIWKRQIPLRLAGPAACCWLPAPAPAPARGPARLVFLAPAPPSVQRLSGCHWQAQAAGVLAASGWAGLGLRAHIASSQSPVPCSSYLGFAVGLCLRQRTATQRVSRRRPSLSGWRERERGGSSVQRARLETDTHRYRTRHHYWGQDFLCTLLKIALNAFPDGTTTRTRCRCVVHRSRHDARPVRRLTAACLRCVHRNVHEVTRLVVTRPEFSSLGRRLHACTGT